MITRTEVSDLLEKIRFVRVGVLGDFCLDAYWTIDRSRSEPSVETGLPTVPVREHRYSLGGAGNVAHNLVTLGAQEVKAFGVLGFDPFGDTMLKQLRALDINTSGILLHRNDWQSHTYIKPHESGKEQSRIDFGNFNECTREITGVVLSSLEESLQELDVIVINQQVPHGIHSEHFRKRLVRLISNHPNVVWIADSRHFSDSYHGCIRKLNQYEAMRICGKTYSTDSPVPLEEVVEAGKTLYQRWGNSLLITRGDRGSVVVSRSGVHHIPAVEVQGQIDPVGAGDTMLAGVALAMGAGLGLRRSALLGSLCASITIKKLYQTGTASPQEVLAVAEEPAFVYNADLADEPRLARFYQNSRIEIVGGFLPSFPCDVIIVEEGLVKLLPDLRNVEGRGVSLLHVGEEFPPGDTILRLRKRQICLWSSEKGLIRKARSSRIYAVGFAFDRRRGTGLDFTKRRELIRAGACAILPDLTEFPCLLRMLGLG